MTSHPRAIAPLDLLQLLAIALIWGTNNVAAKIAIGELPAMMVAGLRFAIILAVLGVRLWPLPKVQWGQFVLLLVLVGPLHFGLQYLGLGLADDLAPMVVAMQLWAPASVLCAIVVLGERVSPLRLAGVGIAFAGAAAMTFDPVVFAQWGALALVGLASCLYGLGAVLMRRLGAAVNAWTMQAWIALASAPLLLGASFTFESGHGAAVRDASWLAWACLLFGGIVSGVVANAFLTRLVQKYEVSRTTPYLLLTPAISFTLAALVLGDDITPRILAGAAATMSGVALMVWAERRLLRAIV